MELSGTGNLGLFQLPELEFPGGLEVFSPKTTVQKDPFRDQISGTRSWEYILIPRRDGDTEKPRGGVRGVIPEKMDYNSAFKRHIEYYHDGQIKEEGFYNKHLPNYFGTGDAKEGEWKTYYKNGQIKSKGRYVNDVWDGKWVYWSENGTIIKEETWRDKDIWDGEAGVSYKAMPGFGSNTPGNKYSKGMKKNGKKIGLWTFWSRDGEKSWKCEFKDDKPWNGTYRETYHTAEKLSEGDYKEGKKVGVWKNWYGHGELSSSGKYLKGKKEGTWTYFSENGVESWTLEYKNGEPMDGLWIEYGYHSDDVVIFKIGQIETLENILK